MTDLAKARRRSKLTCAAVAIADLAYAVAVYLLTGRFVSMHILVMAMVCACTASIINCMGSGEEG